jgi:hypothetical protein
MTIRIDKKITGFDVSKEEVSDLVESNVIQMHEKLERPEMLLGSTYKIKTPLIVLNAGTEHEKRRPFEVFINSKSMDHFQWIVALTRIISAVFRKGGDVTFLVEELHSVFDPRGGYFRRGKYTPSLVAEIGDVIERHLKMIGLISTEENDDRKQYASEKLAEIQAQNDHTEPMLDDAGGYPPEAQLCNKCLTKAVIKMDGCKTCLNCGDSKCG